MTGITIRVPEDIVRALRLPAGAIAAELQREPGPGALTSGASCREGREPVRESPFPDLSPIFPQSRS